MLEALGISRYQETDASSVGPEKIIVMLYEKLLDHLNRASAAISANNQRLATDHINSAQAIVLELRHALDLTIGGDITINLRSIYDYVFQENLKFIVDRDPAHLAHAKRTLEPLLAAWRQIPPGTAEQARRDFLNSHPAEEVTSGLDRASGSPASPSGHDRPPDSARSEPTAPSGQSPADGPSRHHLVSLTA